MCSVLVVAANPVPTQLRDFSQGEAAAASCCERKPNNIIMITGIVFKVTLLKL